MVELSLSFKLKLAGEEAVGSENCVNQESQQAQRKAGAVDERAISGKVTAYFYLPK